MKPLAFPDASFDVVHARLLHAFMPKQSWLEFLQECVRITRPGGYICLTESEWAWTNKEACEELHSRGAQLLWQTGHSFYPGGKLIGVVLMLSQFLRQAGLLDIVEQPHVINFSSGEPAHESMYQMFSFGYQLLFPHFGLTQEAFDRLAQQANDEWQEEDFRGLFFLLRVCGRKPTGTI